LFCPEFPNNRENNREFFEFNHGTLEFCPKSANFGLKQGINREFCGYLIKAASILNIVLFKAGIQKIIRELTGNSAALE
jgi:hypothetical protein